MSDISRFFDRNWNIFYQKSLVFQINVQIWSRIGRNLVRNWFIFLSEFCSSSSKFFLVLVDYWTKYDLTFCSLTTKFCLFLIDFLIDFVWFFNKIWHIFLYEIISISDQCPNLVPNWSIFCSELIHILIWIGEFCSLTFKFCQNNRIFGGDWPIF